MPNQKIYMLIKPEDSDHYAVLPSEDTRKIYLYLDSLIQQGKKWKAFFITAEELEKRFQVSKFQDEELWR